MKTRLGITASLSLALLAGCDADLSSSAEAKDSFRRILQAQSVGRAWDRGERALQNNDAASLSAVRNELRKLGANAEAERLVTTERRAIRSRAELLVIQAIILDSKAYRTVEEQKGQLKQEAATIYRQALQVDPEFSSTYPDLLNAIGYFLADRGTRKSDFILAEKLTRRALQGIKRKTQTRLRRKVTRCNSPIHAIRWRGLCSVKAVSKKLCVNKNELLRKQNLSRATRNRCASYARICNK